MKRSLDDMPSRRCILSGDSQPAHGMVRFVQDPDGNLVPDVAGKLPGRGVWVSADGAALKKALNDGSFAKATSRSLKTGIKKDNVPGDLIERMVALLERRILNRLGLLNRANVLVTGFDKIGTALNKSPNRPVAMTMSATDAASDGVRKLTALVRDISSVKQVFDREALSKALGRENVVHLLVFKDGGTEELTADLSRLEGLRSGLET